MVSRPRVRVTRTPFTNPKWVRSSASATRSRDAMPRTTRRLAGGNACTSGSESRGACLRWPRAASAMVSISTGEKPSSSLARMR